MKLKHVFLMISGLLLTLCVFFTWGCGIDSDCGESVFELIDYSNFYLLLYLIPIIGLILFYKGVTKRNPGILGFLSLIAIGGLVAFSSFIYIYDIGLYMALFGLIFLLASYYYGLELLDLAKEQNDENQQ